MTHETDFTLRPLRAGDRAEWERLWTAYLEFYDASVPPEVYDTTFARLLSDGFWEPSALVFERTGGGAGLVGLVHYLYHAHCWRREPVCYLQDLYVDPACRGAGLGRRLIEGVYAAADAGGAPSVYWMTQDCNSTARRLYDRVGLLTPFVKYSRPI